MVLDVEELSALASLIPLFYSRLSCGAVPLVTRPLNVVFVLINYALFLGGNPYEGMTGEEVFNFVASGQRMCRTSAMSSELYVYLSIARYSLPQVKVISIRKCS